MTNQLTKAPSPLPTEVTSTEAKSQFFDLIAEMVGEGYTEEELNAEFPDNEQVIKEAVARATEEPED